MYAYGQGVQQSREEAITWIELAANQGYFKAQDFIQAQQKEDNQKKTAAKSAISHSFLNIAISALTGWIIYLIINIKGKPVSAIQRGRKWLAITLFFTTLSMLSKFLINFNNEYLYQYIAISLALGLVAFILGMFWHTVKKIFS